MLSVLFFFFLILCSCVFDSLLFFFSLRSKVSMLIVIVRLIRVRHQENRTELLLKIFRLCFFSPPFFFLCVVVVAVIDTFF